jgi:hypothetical protein
MPEPIKPHPSTPTFLISIFSPFHQQMPHKELATKRHKRRKNQSQISFVLFVPFCGLA